MNNFGFPQEPEFPQENKDKLITYQEFLNLPHIEVKDMETILTLKGKYHMTITYDEYLLTLHFERLYRERLDALFLKDEQ